MKYHAAMADPDPHNEVRPLAVLIMRAAERVRGDFSDAVLARGLPTPLARALLALDAPVPMRTLAEQLACDQSYVTGLTDDLEARGLVTRVPGKDRRVKVLTLTRAGEKVRRELARAVTESSSLLSHLSPGDRHTLTRLLTTLLDDRA